ncbi:N-acetylmuramoyl-L-alanine amidase [Stigmatella aurantiaca]|uniref:N-acetylmuramoyl-L-alanine amidase n=1 Tax=Stigmatella aurantiaca TaxID=41 RepID=A0A1H7J429_STIAU|nr:N-acetylmuramoyl-L-alanine amidase [Stigmatella aurantiaca]SEK69336.1 N-acetylmuramoyl-L-alanine amidase [Stigmatella aurantiaca]
MDSLRNPLAAAALALALSACGPQTPEGQEPAQSPASNAVADAARDAAGKGVQEGLDPLFEKAAREFNVPADLLKSISFTETRWQMVRGEEEFEGLAPAFGVMALRGERLERGAALAGVSAEAARTDVLANIRAGAALLSAEADALKVNRADLGDWAPAVVRLSGITHTDAQAEYVHNEVFATLRQGVVAEAEGTVTASIMPTEVQAKFALPALRTQSADYGPAIWRASPNFNARPAGTDISMIVIHTCEGGYSGCWSWLANSSAGASAHYVVNESGSEITQLVTEANRAWHVAASYSCSLNGNVSCGLNGLSTNHFSVGIEHGGYASQTSFPAGQITASAKLTCDISKSQGVVRDSYHIVAHGRLQPSNRTDPGPNWPWASYIDKVKAECGEGGGTTPSPTAITVDSDNANNNAAVAKFTGSASWITSSASAGYYGSNYTYAATQPISDTVTFSFYLSAAGARTIDAYWVAGTNRSTATPFIISNAAGTELGRVAVNQQVNGGKFNALGTWNFSAGWNTVKISRWAPEGFVVVADAIRVR